MRNSIVIVIVLFLCSLKVHGEEKLKLDCPRLEPGVVAIRPVELSQPEGLSLSEDNYPHTSGSTSAEPMGVWIACRLLKRDCRWPDDSTGERRLLPLRKGQYRNRSFYKAVDSGFYRKIRHFGTHGSYVKLIKGEVDLIFECRKPSKDEYSLMSEESVGLDIKPIALDAFVFLKHKDNPVKNLTLDQIRDIFTHDTKRGGKIANWKELGGLDKRVTPFIRNRNSGSQETMMSLVMKRRRIVNAGRMVQGKGMSSPYNMMVVNAFGIGFTFYYYQRYMAPLYEAVGQKSEKQETQKQKKAAGNTIKMFAVNGVAPSRDTIVDQSYPLVTAVYAVVRKNMRSDHPAVRLRDWLLTEEGQKIISETGYVPLNDAGHESIPEIKGQVE